MNQSQSNRDLQARVLSRGVRSPEAVENMRDLLLGKLATGTGNVDLGDCNMDRKATDRS